MPGRVVNVKQAIRELSSRQQAFTSSDAAAAAGVSRQAAHAHLSELVGTGELQATGKGRARRYGRPGAFSPRPVEHKYRTEGLQEDQVWRRLLADTSEIRRLPKSAQTIFQYAFTEILNNAIEHSGAYEVVVMLERTPNAVAFVIADEGVGIFERIKSAYDLRTDLDAIAELQKGKVTTNPERHTGEGIFFVSKAADYFEIQSGAVVWKVDNIRHDNAVGSAPGFPRQGTRVRFEIAPTRSETLEEIFRPYSKEFAFDTTRILVRLFDHGTRFISRSEARRLTAGLERFREVILDFERVEAVGQGFADEVFRVWAPAHPSVTIATVNAAAPVAFMLERAKAEAKSRPTD